MGQYLAIGIATGLCFKKKEAESAFDSVSNAKKYIEENYTPLDVYNMTESDEHVRYTLKSKVLESEIVGFLSDFYSERLSMEKDHCDGSEVLSALKKVHTAEEIMSLADEKISRYFRLDAYWDPIWIRKKAWHGMYIYREGIDISLDGKILMECYNSIFGYFSSVLHDKYKKYSLSKSLHVTITG